VMGKFCECGFSIFVCFLAEPNKGEDCVIKRGIRAYIKDCRKSSLTKGLGKNLTIKFRVFQFN